MNQPTHLKGGPGRMLHLAEMAAVQDAHMRQPAEVLAQAAAYIKAKGLPEIKPLPVVIKPVPI